MKPGDKVYLGDSVYAQFDGYDVVLTTENGYGPNNTIALEPYVYTSLIHFASSPEEDGISFRIPEVNERGT